MADVGEEEEYESDPEQAKLSLKMRRRREASDDEEENDGGDVRVRERVTDSRVSDCESDCQGAAAEYDDDEYDLVEEEEELLEEVEVEEEFGEERGGCEVQGVIDGGSVGVKRENDQTDGDEFYVRENDDNGNVRVEEGGQEERKENEPFAVPTAGAFYMHDDRFRDSADGKHRRTLGGRKLWELRDDRKWGHDKFEEMTMQERHYDESRRVSRGHNQARGRGSNRGDDRGYVRGNRPKAYHNRNNQNNAHKSLRGRGTRRYQSSVQNNSEPPAQSRRPTKPVEKTASSATSTSESAQVSARKSIVASNLNSASLPFYPSGSLNKEINNLRGRNASDSLGMDKLYIDDSVSSLGGKPLNFPPPASGPSFVNPTQPLQSRVEGRGAPPLGQMVYQPVPPRNQINRVSSPNQFHSFQRAPVLNQLPPNVQPSGQQLGPHSASGSRSSSPPKASGSTHPHDSAEPESPPESIDFNTALVGKGNGGIQNSGMSSFAFSRSLGGNHGDQNFPGTPTFLPVMQFGGQHPGGLGVPAVGMAFPGYVAQPNGMGNSEMTWLPVLAGAAGALGATYCSPYITMDGGFHAPPSVQTPSLAPASSKDSNTNKPGNEMKPSQRPEPTNDELRQRQNKARRYTEMKFDK